MKKDTNSLDIFIVPIPEEETMENTKQEEDSYIHMGNVDHTVEVYNKKILNRKGRIKLKYRTKEDDIKYRAPLSYRYLRIIGWLFLAVSQLSLIFKLAVKINPSVKTSTFATAGSILSFVSSLPLALFMLANLGIILRNRKNFRYLFTFYGGMMVCLYVIANIVVLHYVYGLLRAINSTTSFMDVSYLVSMFLMSSGTIGYIFNLFVDLFLCVLTVFFLFYNPKTKAFQGKNVLIFRSFVVLPIFYELASIFIKYYSLLGNLQISHFAFFLLTCKPPLTFLAFFIVTVVLKVREKNFLKYRGNDEELLQDHQSTNAHSFRTSITISVAFTIAAVSDFIIYLIYGIYQFAKRGGGGDDVLYDVLSSGSSIGLGGSAPLLFIAPFILLYSYTKTHKNKKLDSFLPIIGIVLIVLTVFEGFYLVVRLTIPQWINSLEGLIEGDETGEEEWEPTFEAIKNSFAFLYRVWR